MNKLTLQQLNLFKMRLTCYNTICYNYKTKYKKQLTLRLCFGLGFSALFLFLCLAASAMLLLLLSKSCISLKKASSLKRISEISTRRSSPQSFRERPTNLLRESCNKKKTKQKQSKISERLFDLLNTTRIGSV